MVFVDNLSTVADAVAGELEGTAVEIVEGGGRTDAVGAALAGEPGHTAVAAVAGNVVAKEDSGVGTAGKEGFGAEEDTADTAAVVVAVAAGEEEDCTAVGSGGSDTTEAGTGCVWSKFRIGHPGAAAAGAALARVGTVESAAGAAGSTAVGHSSGRRGRSPKLGLNVCAGRPELGRSRYGDQQHLRRPGESPSPEDRRFPS